MQFRRDIGVAVSFLISQVRTRTEEDWVKLRRLLKHINGTRDLYLVFSDDCSGLLSMFVSIYAFLPFTWIVKVTVVMCLSCYLVA